MFRRALSAYFMFSILIHRLFYVHLYIYLHIYTNINIYIYIYIIYILYDKNISTHSIHSIRENEKAAKTNENQRKTTKNCPLAKFRRFKPTQRYAQVYAENILAVGPCRLGSTTNLLSPSLRSLPPPLLPPLKRDAQRTARKDW